MATRKDSKQIALVPNGRQGNRMYVLTQEQKEKMRELAGYMSGKQIGEYFGIDRNTITCIRKRDEELDRLYLQGRAERLEKYVQALEGKALGYNPIGDTSAITFYLKTQGGWRTADTIEQIAGGETDKYYPPEIKAKYARMIELDKICAFFSVDEVREIIKEYTVDNDSVSS